jgi:hypothetical protein
MTEQIKDKFWCAPSGNLSTPSMRRPLCVKHVFLFLDSSSSLCFEPGRQGAQIASHVQIVPG